MHALFGGVCVIPVLTIEREADAVPLARALLDGGLRLIEVTLRTPAAPAAIAAIAREVPQIVIGAGTVQRQADVVPAVRTEVHRRSPSGSEGTIAVRRPRRRAHSRGISTTSPPGAYITTMK